METLREKRGLRIVMRGIGGGGTKGAASTKHPGEKRIGRPAGIRITHGPTTRGTHRSKQKKARLQRSGLSETDVKTR